MTEILKAGALCPIRVTEDDIEVLLTRRTFWNYEKNRPFSLPGEWTFAGGLYDEEDDNLAETAMREFREETNYDGQIRSINFLRSGTQDAFWRTYLVEFYSARINSDYQFTLMEKGEVIEIQWIRPADALSLIQSDEFTIEQSEEFRRRGLNDAKYGIHAVTERSLPVQNILTLEHIQSIPELIELYR